MSVQFGRWSFDGLPASPEYWGKARRMLSPYGPDGEASYSGGGVDILYYAFHTTKESRREIQPRVVPSGAVVIWDGRLDNREEILRMLGGSLPRDAADVAIVSEAYQSWGIGCLRQLIGDWAVSVWNPHERSLILAKDPIGTRQLYYSIQKDALTWSSVLDPLILLAGRGFEINEEYVAGWISLLPAAHLTPYVGIDSVPPCCFVRFEPGRQTVGKYWDFDPNKRIRYPTDAQYEEHFRAVFGEAVRRRLRSDAPILAELSGGIDSSSIVCMADRLLAAGMADTPRLDTVSYYDDSEPNWNERPYFSVVEQKRGVKGWHIEVGRVRYRELVEPDREDDHFRALPGSRSKRNEASQQFAECARSHGNRVLLSGIGGDETMGGVPTPIPELADLLTSGRFWLLARQLKLWALNKRLPWLQLLVQVIRAFLPPRLPAALADLPSAPWLEPQFIRRNRRALAGYPARTRLFGALPSFQENLGTLDALRRQLACYPLQIEPLCERRYPYLDRDLLEFAYAVPREQLVRPGQRRSLMRRALVAIVPGEILHRRRKAFVARSLVLAITEQRPNLGQIEANVLHRLPGVVNAEAFRRSLETVGQGRQAAVGPILRMLAIESWLRRLDGFKLRHLDAEPARGPEAEMACHTCTNARRICIPFS